MLLRNTRNYPFPPPEPAHIRYRRSRLSAASNSLHQQIRIPLCRRSQIRPGNSYRQFFLGLGSWILVKQNGHFITGPLLLIQKLSFRQEPVLYYARV